MTSVLIIAVAALLYGLFHSILASLAVKRALQRWLGRTYRLFSNVIAGITLLPVLALVPLLPDRVLYLVSSPWRWGMVGLQFAAVLAAGWVLLQTDALRFLGVRQLFQAEPLARNQLQIVGLYQWTRHPLYFFSLIFLWFSPVMTLNQLALYTIFSLYFWVGAVFEERKLAAQFGGIYRAYQQQVPMLIPWKRSLWSMRANADEFRTYLEDYSG